MNSISFGTYYWGDHFSAVSKPLANGGGSMWFLLPDDGITIHDLLSDMQSMEFLLSNGDWDNSKYLKINLSIPKFDLSAQTDLQHGLQALGVTDVFDMEASDFSPMTSDMDKIFLSQAIHGVRVAIDEEGISAASYTVMSADASAAPQKDEVDFTLDRPFLFILLSDNGLPLFVGSVYEPAA